MTSFDPPKRKSSFGEAVPTTTPTNTGLGEGQEGAPATAHVGAGARIDAARLEAARAARKLWDSLPRMASDIRAVRRRATVVAGVLVTSLLALVVRAHEVAVDHHEAYAAQGNRQQIRNYELTAGRGGIVDRNGISLAMNDRVHHVAINPRQIAAAGVRDEVFTALWNLAPHTDPEELRAELDRTDKAYRRLRLRLDDARAKELTDLGLPGVALESGGERVYPRALLASHVLGRVDGDGNGTLGVELGMDEWLRGRDTTSPAWFASHRGHGKKLLVEGHPDPGVARGHTVVLTLDSAMQAMAEEELDRVVAEWHPVGASIVVLDPANGEVLALANRPSFDPNHRVESVDQTNNLAVQAAYEPGSTLKAITVAAGLEQGTIRKDQTFYCEKGRWQYTPQHAIRDTKHSEWLDVTEILATSSNICTTKIYETLGKESLHRWVRRFHFGERPEIELPGASAGLLADWREWSDIQGANVSFGQGMSASPLQVAAAFSALANGGMYVQPTIVREVLAHDGSTEWSRELVRERVVSESTAKTVMEMLTAVVHTKKGTGKNATIPGYVVAGKTSTAQKANPAGGYFEDQYYASFVGAVPADNPRVVILVSVDNPEGGHFGNDVAAPAFARLGERVMTYLGVPRSDGTTPQAKRVAIAANDPKLVEGFIPEIDVEPALPGERRVKQATGLPDFTGLTIAQAFEAAETAKVELVATGSGIAVGQDLPPGAVDSGTRVHVHFESPY
jgi:cell division protein FtsI (penicillin-binding protein 3)